MAKITYDQLCKIGACPEKEIFKQKFGDFLTLTPDIAAQFANSFDTRMSIMRLLTQDQLREWAKRMHARTLGKTFKGNNDPEFRALRARVAAEIYCEAQDGTK